jgi:F-type H+-transporting ATPase subunit gamma
MATLREIRQRISSVKSTQQITKAMKMVAAAKLRRAQESIVAIRPYAYNLRDMIAHLADLDENVVNLPLLEKRPVEKVLIVTVAADRGLCGGFNSNIMRAAVSLIGQYADTSYDLLTVGNKSSEFFGKRDYPIYKKQPNFFNDLTFEDAVSLSRTLISAYESKEYDRIEIVYNEFKSAIQQNVITEQFLPFKPQESDEQNKRSIDYIYEPDIKTILNALIPKDLNIQIWRILLESNAAEQGARMTAMENATENAEEMKSNLTLHYNRARQAAITKELSEIVAGADALKES